MSKNIEINEKQAIILEKAYGGNRFVEIDGLILDKDSLSYYNESCAAYLNEPADVLNAINKMLQETKESIEEKIKDLKQELVDALTPRGADKNDDYRRW